MCPGEVGGGEKEEERKTRGGRWVGLKGFVESAFQIKSELSVILTDLTVACQDRVAGRGYRIARAGRLQSERMFMHAVYWILGKKGRKETSHKKMLIIERLETLAYTKTMERIRPIAKVKKSLDVIDEAPLGLLAVGATATVPLWNPKGSVVVLFGEVPTPAVDPLELELIGLEAIAGEVEGEEAAVAAAAAAPVVVAPAVVLEVAPGTVPLAKACCHWARVQPGGAVLGSQPPAAAAAATAGETLVAVPGDATPF